MEAEWAISKEVHVVLNWQLSNHVALSEKKKKKKKKRQIMYLIQIYCLLSIFNHKDY